VGLFDFLRGKPRRMPRGRIDISRRDNNDLAWWWIYLQQQTPPGDDAAFRQLEEACRAHGVDPASQGAVDVGSVPGLEDSLADVCRQNGVEAPAADATVVYDATTGTVELPGGVDASSWAGDAGVSSSESGAGSDSGGSGGGDSGGGDSGGGGGGDGGGGGGGGE